MPAKKQTSPYSRACSGIPGLDDVLAGGFPTTRLYLIKGIPGTGKTTLAIQFLIAGRENDESTLYITLSETRDEIDAVAVSHQWNLEGISFIELSNIEDRLKPETQTTLLHPAEVELARTVRIIEEQVEALRPTRVVIDSLSELRLLAQNSLRYRRQILALKTFFSTRNCTVLLLDDGSTLGNDEQIESLAHGVLELEHLKPDYGSERRRLSVSKLRGVRFRGGYHDYLIRTGGLEVFPRLVAAEHQSDFVRESIKSEVVELDKLLGGGLDRGTCSLFLGPAGCGKSSLSMQYVAAAARRGENCAVFAFDENLGIIRSRAEELGMRIKDMVDSGTIRLQQVDPAELAPGEFAAIVRQRVEEDNARVVVIDSLNGYMNAMPDERFLIAQLHELLTYLAQRGVTTILVIAQHGLVGSMQSPVDLTYLADTVVMLRYFEFKGHIKKAISIIKKRSGDHEETIREFSMVRGRGFQVGEPLINFQGVLTGVPTYTGSETSILSEPDDSASR